MLVINVSYYVKKGQRDKFLSEIRAHGIDAASKAEKGCLAYDYYFSPDNEDILFLNEIWESEEDLKAHAEAPHFAKVQELKAVYTDNVELVKFSAEKL